MDYIFRTYEYMHYPHYPYEVHKILYLFKPNSDDITIRSKDYGRDKDDYGLFVVVNWPNPKAYNLEALCITTRLFGNLGGICTVCI